MTLNIKNIFIILIIIVIVVVAIVLIAGLQNRKSETKFDFITDDLQKIKQADLLTAEGVLIKKELIKPLGGKPGIIIGTRDFVITYLPAPDQFDVEIRTEQTEIAKADAIAWLKSRGLNESDICALPIIFNLELGVSQKLKDEGVEFKRLPEFCSALLGTE